MMKCGTSTILAKNAFNAAPDRYDASITKGFGKPEGIEDYCRKLSLSILNLIRLCMRVGWIVCGGCIRYHDLDGTVGISVYGLANL